MGTAQQETVLMVLPCPTIALPVGTRDMSSAKTFAHGLPQLPDMVSYSATSTLETLAGFTPGRFALISSATFREY